MEKPYLQSLLQILGKQVNLMVSSMEYLYQMKDRILPIASLYEKTFWIKQDSKFRKI